MRRKFDQLALLGVGWDKKQMPNFLGKARLLCTCAKWEVTSFLLKRRGRNGPDMLTCPAWTRCKTKTLMLFMNIRIYN